MFLLTFSTFIPQHSYYTVHTEYFTVTIIRCQRLFALSLENSFQKMFPAISPILSDQIYDPPFKKSLPCFPLVCRAKIYRIHKKALVLCQTQFTIGTFTFFPFLPLMLAIRLMLKKNAYSLLLNTRTFRSLHLFELKIQIAVMFQGNYGMKVINFGNVKRN